MLCARDIFSWLVTLMHKKEGSRSCTRAHAHTLRLCIFFCALLCVRFGQRILLGTKQCAHMHEGAVLPNILCHYLCLHCLEKGCTHREGSWTRSLRLMPLRSSARFRKQLSLTGGRERERAILVYCHKLSQIITGNVLIKVGHLWAKLAKSPSVFLLPNEFYFHASHYFS